MQYRHLGRGTRPAGTAIERSCPGGRTVPVEVAARHRHRVSAIDPGRIGHARQLGNGRSGQLGMQRMHNGQLLVRCRSDHLAGPGDLRAVLGPKIDTEHVGVGDHVEHAAPGHVDEHPTVFGNVDLGIEVQRKGGNVAKRHPGHLAAPTMSSDLDQPGRGIQREFGDRLDHLDHARLQQSGDDTDRVASRHRRIFALFHDDETGIGLGVAGRHDHIATEAGVAARLSQHATPDVVGLRFQPLHLGQHRLARRVEDSGRDDATRLALGMNVDGSKHVGETHGGHRRAVARQTGQPNNCGCGFSVWVRISPT